MSSEFRVSSCVLRGGCAPIRLQLTTRNSKLPRGISLLEVLLSMFVLLFGLMGVAALFPVGNYFVKQGEKFENGTRLAQNAFDELTSRGILRPEVWLYADVPPGAGFVDTIAPNGFFNVPLPVLPADRNNSHPGHVFVIDPLGRAAGQTLGTVELEGFPLWDLQSGQETEALGMPMVWDNAMWAANVIPGGTWPIRRLTLPQTLGTPMTTPVAETIFRLRDDISVESPEADDHPSMQLWKTDGAGALLSRQYHGNYSWLATVVPTSSEALAGLQPADPGHLTYYYDVSVVVFYKRDFVPSDASERLIEAQLLPGGGELEIFSTLDAATVDAAVEDIRAGNWIAITGVNQVTGDFMMKWYRMLSLDEETSEPTTGQFSRFAMLAGPEWPSHSKTDLRAILLPGAISVATQQMKME